MFTRGECVIYDNNGDPVEAVVYFVSALGNYIIKWPGHTCTARENELTAPGLQPCGHPVRAVQGEGLTHWCGMCAEEAKRNT